jgi:hypothetical protein
MRGNMSLNHKSSRNEMKGRISDEIYDPQKKKSLFCLLFSSFSHDSECCATFAIEFKNCERIFLLKYFEELKGCVLKEFFHTIEKLN